MSIRRWGRVIAVATVGAVLVTGTAVTVATATTATVTTDACLTELAAPLIDELDLAGVTVGVDTTLGFRLEVCPTGGDLVPGETFEVMWSADRGRYNDKLDGTVTVTVPEPEPEPTPVEPAPALSGDPAPEDTPTAAPVAATPPAPATTDRTGTPVVRLAGGILGALAAAAVPATLALTRRNEHQEEA